MMELSPVLVWLVVLVLGLQIAEFGLRAARGLARRMGRSHSPDQRERFLAMTPLEKIEAFKLDQLSDEALQLLLAGVDLPGEERARIEALLGLGRHDQRTQPDPAHAEAPALEARAADVLSLPLKAAARGHPAKQGAAFERR
jgi:hypothetical protein